MRKYLVLTLVVALLVFGASLTSAQDLGSADNPIQVYFVPSVEAQTLVEGGEVLRQALEDATGLSFEVFVPTSYAATIEAMCASPDNSMGFIPAAGFVIGNNRCGIEVEAAAVRFGWPVYWAQYLVARDSDIYVLGDLEGKTWAYPDPGSTSGFIVPSVELQAAGIEPGERVEAGGHNQAVLAVYNGEVDFATSFFSPPVMPGAQWDFGDLPEPYDLTVDEAYINDEGRLYVGDIRIMDSRSSVRETAPDIVDKVRILRISAPIPNDTMSFSPGFPEDLRQQILDALIAFSGTEAWATSALGSEDGYSWTTLQPVEDSLFNSVRLQFEILGLTEADIFGDE
ncbi:MAG: phosphate/phosphite/phosphonate ABC transporter substrate-binding protein [Anaerolineae bacterium]|nr:phosphate/phosphite/phosphonate ABC transporter substrate-binding protein [Anaerolineae bacterium]MCA9895007.1 phosphate/phosphite/phosphonate ABC transporter substrate-binding protein [Anaerolineae bacterium]MCB9459738.1 phosphate/phosphite/phosphonate ABC transporter substrate-binding protein [Anaerolineaceae bacterium]